MKTAMILAAGRGERLKPFTDFHPKPLCLIKGMPLIEYHIINLAKAAFDRIIINHAYLGSQLRHYLGDGKKWGVTIEYSPEPPGGLETGGGIVNALPLLGEAPFLVVNADIFTSMDLSKIYLPKDAYIHLVLGENPAHNRKGDFGLHQGQVTNAPKAYTFLGIACYHPRAFQQAKFGRYSVMPYIVRKLAEQSLVTGEIFTGTWWDIGTCERLKEANLQ